MFLEDRLETSSRFFDMVWRSFVRGAQCVPAAGMGAIPAQLAAALPPGTVRLGAAVRQVAAGRADGEPVRAVVVAADPSAAAGLLPGLGRPRDERRDHPLPPAPRRRRSPSRRSSWTASARARWSTRVVLTNAAPSYAPGRHLVSSSVVSGDASEPAVRAHLSRLYDVDTRAWRHVAAYDVREALPSQAPPVGRLRRPVRLERGLYVCGDSRDSASIQGALVSGRRAALAVLADLRD